MRNALLTFLILFLLIVIGSFIGNWDEFILRNTGLELKGVNSEHRYIVDATTGLTLVPQHILDIQKEKNFVYTLRMNADSYECLTTSGDILIFTHYQMPVEVAVIDLMDRSVSTYSQTDFLALIGKQGISISFDFNPPFSNDAKFREINKNNECSRI